MLDAEQASLVLIFVGVVFSIAIHECAHGVVAYWRGDPTAYYSGRITLNPIPHIDPFMTLILPAILLFTGGPVFGGARPVPVDTLNLANPRRDMMWIAAAGPASNMLLAVAFALAGNIVVPIARYNVQFAQSLAYVFVGIVYANVFLAAFNMLPIPPLDGSKVLAGLLPPEQGEALLRIPVLQGFIVLGLFIFIVDSVPALAHIWDPVFALAKMIWNTCTFL